MTQKDIDKFLADTKVYVAGKSYEIQNKLFSFGYKWHRGDTNVCYTDAPFLFIFDDKSFTRDDDMEVFSKHENREISAEEIISLVLTSQKYRPFKDREECWNEMLKHEPFGWIKHTDLQVYVNCGYIDKDCIDVSSYETVHKHYTFVDGTPFGIKED